MTQGQWIGLVGGLLGASIGVAGGIWGTWNSIRTTRGPLERAFVKRASAWGWILVTLFLACLFLIPKPWGWLIWLVYGPLMAWGIRAMNAGQARVRSLDAAQSEGGRATEDAAESGS